MQKLNRPDPDKPSGRFCPTCGVEEPHYWYDLESLDDELWLRVSTNYRPGPREWLRSVYEAARQWNAHEALIPDQQTLKEYVEENMGEFRKRWLNRTVYTRLLKGRKLNNRRINEI